MRFTTTISPISTMYFGTSDEQCGSTEGCCTVSTPLVALLVLLSRRMMFDEGVRAREEEALVSITPANEIGRTSLVALDRQNHPRTVTLSDVVAANNQPITHCGIHRHLLSELSATESASSFREGGFRVEGPEPTPAAPIRQWRQRPG
jgi:hypothetical protein